MFSSRDFGFASSGKRRRSEDVLREVEAVVQVDDEEGVEGVAGGDVGEAEERDQGRDY